MDTLWINEDQIEIAAKLLQEGKQVAFPTETVYGLGADATNSQAVKGIFKAKGRPQDNPLIVHLADSSQVNQWIKVVPEKAKKLMDRFWPGPLTIILEVEEGVFAKEVTAGQITVGIRVPDHPLARDLIEQTGLPLAAPSANSSGKPSPTQADHVWHDLKGKIAGVIKAGSTGVGLESTVIEVAGPEETVTILRPGGVSKEALEEVVGPVSLDPSLIKTNDNTDLSPKAPGMKYKHYTPKEDVYMVTGDWENAIKKLLNEDLKIGILANDMIIQNYGNQVVSTYSLGEKKDAKEASQRLFSGLRYFEETDANVILVETFEKTGIGLAFMNRLEKAAGYKTI